MIYGIVEGLFVVAYVAAMCILTWAISHKVN